MSVVVKGAMTSAMQLCTRRSSFVALVYHISIRCCHCRFSAATALSEESVLSKITCEHL